MNLKAKSGFYPVPDTTRCAVSFLPRKGGQWGLPIFPFQKVKRVVGIELCQEAVEDARVNALTNGENFCRQVVWNSS